MRILNSIFSLVLLIQLPHSIYCFAPLFIPHIADFLCLAFLTCRLLCTLQLLMHPFPPTPQLFSFSLPTFALLTKPTLRRGLSRVGT